MRPRKPWYRRATDAWYVQVDGKQQLLAKGKANRVAAETAYHRLMVDGGRDSKPENALSVATLCDLFLDSSQIHNAASTYEWQKHFLNSFCARYAGLDCGQLKPFHLSRWLDANKQWTGGRRSAQVIVKRVFAWGKEEGLIGQNPFAHVKNPGVSKRERIISADEKALILESIKDDAFRNFMLALFGTGCRPSEVARVSSEDVNLALGVWKFDQHKTRKKTGKPRIVYLSAEMLELTKSQLAKHAVGPLFPNIRGRAFTPNAWRCRFRRLRERFPKLQGVVAYCCRHSYATQALINGVGIAQVATLLGHSDTNMVATTYSHIAANVAHMREAASKAGNPNVPHL